MSACVESLRSTGLAAPHGFFTRLGGVSGGPYASLNCSLSGQDSPGAVLENRARAARTIGAKPGGLVGLTQVHGAEVVHVTNPCPPGAGPRADAMVTDHPAIALGIVTADCAPILFADMRAGVVAAAHAGWRGAVAGIIEATVAAMTRLGANPATTMAVIGPCIQPDSYEVGTDLRDAVLSREPTYCRFFAPGHREARWQFDLPGYCATRLAEARIRFVEIIDADTVADEARFFSHRRRTLAGGGPIGHQISIIALELV
jgi:polyphenol oxidase